MQPAYALSELAVGSSASNRREIVVGSSASKVDLLIGSGSGA